MGKEDWLNGALNNEQKRKNPEHERCQRHWTFEQYEFSSFGRELYLSVFLTLTPLLTRSLACSRFLFDAGAIVLSGSCCFYWVANPPLLHPQRWKPNPGCGNVVSKPLSKKTPIIIALCENYISHACLWSEPRGFLSDFFGRRTEADHSYWEGCEQIQFVSSSSLSTSVSESTAVTQFVCLII